MSILKSDSVSNWIGQRYPGLLKQITNAFNMPHEKEGGEQPEAAPTRQPIDEGGAAQLLAALVPHVERLIEADLRLKYPNIPVAGSLAVRAFTAERLLVNEAEPPDDGQDEQLLLLQNYLALHRTVSLLEAIERNPQSIWRIASGRAA